MDNLKEYNSAYQQNNNLGYKVIIGVLLVLLGIMSYLYFSQHNKTTQTIVLLNEVNHEKEDLTFQYQDLLTDFEGLQTSNDSISGQLEAEKERVKKLMTELRSVKADNKAQIEKYKKELSTLRDIMKSFIHQIDSLNTLNIELTQENQRVKQQYSTAQKENKQLNEKFVEASTKVAAASVLKAVNVKMLAYNDKGKEVTRSRKVKRIAVNLALDENVIAPRGLKNVFIRITDPQQHVLIRDDLPMFTYQGEQIALSAVREVEYNGEVTPLIIYYEHANTELVEGIYNVDIFCDGNMIGSSSLTLK